MGLAAAIRYVSGLGLDNIAAHEQKLTDMAVEGLKAMPRLTVLAPDVPHSAVVSVLAGASTTMTWVRCWTRWGLP